MSLPNNLKSLSLSYDNRNFTGLSETNLTYLNISNCSKKISVPSSLKHLRIGTESLNLYKNIVETLETFSIDYVDPRCQLTINHIKKFLRLFIMIKGFMLTLFLT